MPFSYRATVLPVPILYVDQGRKIPEKMGSDEILFFSLTRKKQKAFKQNIHGVKGDKSST